MHANINVREPGQPHDTETPFAFSMEGAMAQVPPELLPVIWAPGWDSNQSINKFQEEIGGHLRGGDTGVRLLEKSGSLEWFSDIPAAFKPVQGVWRIIRLPHIFGSEELSLHSPSIPERFSNFCVLINPLDAETLGVSAGEQVAIINFDGSPDDGAGDEEDLINLEENPILEIAAEIDNNLPRGLLVITAGLPKFQLINTWTQVTLKKVNQEGLS
jgi:NADH-quinone oxidoreductase subunit G